MICAAFCVVDNVVYMGIVNISKKTWYVLICVMFQISGDPEAHSHLGSFPLLNRTTKQLNKN